MKKLVMVLMSVFCFQSVTFADNDRLIQFAQLPAEAQQIVNTHFNNKKVAYIMLDPGYLKSYEVVFDDATKVEFNKKGQWKEVDMNTQAVPSEFIPEAIQAYVNTAFPDAFICHIDVEKGKKEVKLLVHESLQTGGRDDNFTLYGFATRQERELYRMLISVSGVGANTARMMLSSITPAELCDAIASGNEKLIKGVKGIGLKTAQRIIVDLKDKIAASGIADELHVASGRNESPAVNNAVKDEAVAALTMLGFSPAPAAKVVVAILTEQPDLAVEMVVKEALKRIK